MAYRAIPFDTGLSLPTFVNDMDNNNDNLQNVLKLP